jgi:hypothetical protein
VSKTGLETQLRLGDGLGLPSRDRGTGPALPTTNLRRGDGYYHTGWGCLLEYTGVSWRALEKGYAANKAAIDQLYGQPAGLQMVAQDTGWTWEWTGTFWKITTPGVIASSVYMNADRATGSGWQMVYCPVRRYDPLNAYDVTGPGVNPTSGEFAAPLNGLYRLAGVVGYTVGTGNRGAAFIRAANGTFIEGSGQIVGATTIQTVVATATVVTALTAGQLIYLAGYSSVTGLSHMGAAAGQQCGMTIELVEQTG